MPQTYPEGTIADGPNGPLVWNGRRWVAVQAQPAQPQMPADPAYPYQGPAAAANVDQSQAGARNTNATATVTEATTPTTVVTANLPEGMMWVDPSNPRVGMVPIPRNGNTPVTSDQAVSDRDRLARLNSLTTQINRVQELFNQGPGSTHGVWSLGDYLPNFMTPSNARFDTAGASLAQQGLGAFRVPGTGTVSDRDAAMFDRANLPNSMSSDASNAEILAGLRARVEEEYRALGQPAPNWTGVPAATPNRRNGDAAGYAAGGQSGGNPPGPSALDQLFGAPNTPMAPSGDSGVTSDPLPPGYDAAHRQMMADLIASGNFTPDAYVQKRAELDARFPTVNNDPAASRAWAEQVQAYIQGGGRTVPMGVTPPDRAMTGVEQFRNSIIDNPAGAAAAGFTNMFGFGGVEALAGDQYNALRDSRPVATTVGEIAGTLAPTSGIAHLGAGTASRFAPRLLGGGTMGGIARGVATDATYGGIYGAVTGQNPLETATESGAGSLIGQTGSRMLGGIARGVAATQPVQTLLDRGIPLTIGQRLGGFAKSTEDAMTSIPVVGDMVNARRMDGLDAFNMAALADAGRPIGFVPNRIGRQGVADLMGDRAAGTRGAISNAYDRAVAGVNLTPDQQFIGDVNAAMAQAERLPPDLRSNAELAFSNTFDPLANNPSINGPQFQGMRSDLSGHRASQTGPGFPSNYRDVMTGGISALDGLVNRQAGPEVTAALGQANTANRLGNIVQDAAFRADGADYRFTPSQLQDAIKSSQRSFPANTPLLDLADAGQQVLPSRIPDSGTGRRIAQMALPGAVTSGGAAIGGASGYMANGNEGAAHGAASGGLTTAALMAMLMAGGTKQGQRAIGRVLFDRPPTVAEFGRQLGYGTAPILRRGYTGLFGSAMVPVTMQASGN